jgi:mersacidin/lichenicidin family type 2 lantibiotic
MKELDVVRAWKDPRYRASLDPSDASKLPPNPAGLVELSDEDLKQASGLASYVVTTGPTCTMYTSPNIAAARSKGAEPVSVDHPVEIVVAGIQNRSASARSRRLGMAAEEFLQRRILGQGRNLRIASLKMESSAL